MNKFDFIEMSLPAKAEYVGMLRLTISGIASRMGFSYDAIEDLKIAISEAVTNVVTHAYEGEAAGELTLGYRIYKNRLEIMVSDQGESFRLDDIKNRIGPVTAKEERKPVSQFREGGFGLFLINTLMDKVELNNQEGVVLLMTKYIDETEVDQLDKSPTRK